jgi:hypothetical protein
VISIGFASITSSRPPIDVLYELRQTKPEVFSQLEVWVDGGVRRGTDVVKGALWISRSCVLQNANLFKHPD